jgi:hypothetical protein
LRLTLPGLLLALTALLAAGDAAWAVLGHFQLDTGAYLRLGLMAAALLAGARLYQTVRPDPRLAAMLFGTGFLCAFSIGASLLNYLLLTHTGARIDGPLAALDRAMGFDWPAAMSWMAVHPRLNAVAFIAYGSMLPQVALLTVMLATHAPAQVYRFSAALALSALVCIGIWSLAPSFGAFSVYGSVPSHMILALDPTYARDLVKLLKDGPGLISPVEAKGLIGFPSYHAVLALLVMWHARGLKHLRIPAILLNIVVLLATPIQGGHHLVDVLGAIPVAAFALFIVETSQRTETAMKPSIVVNKLRKFTIRPVPQGLFRITAEQDDEAKPAPIKPKLSGFP